jgi:parallel beta-helix repeat protein
MPTVNLSALAGAGQQFFDNNGNPLSGGKLYSYEAGTTTPQVTYTSASGATAHTNPIVLDSAGRITTGEIWLTAGQNYKFVLKTSTEVTIATWDNITGINGTGIATNANSVEYDPPFTGSVSTTVEAKLAQYVSVKDFGASPSATAANNTTFINAAITYAAANGLGVDLVGGAYPIQKIRIKNGLRSFGNGKLIPSGLFGEAAIEFDGGTLSGTAVTRCLVENIEMDCTNGPKRAIYGEGTNFCQIQNNTFYNIAASSGTIAGILLTEGAFGNKIAFNTVLGTPLDTSGVMIGLFSAGANDNYSYFINADGSCTQAANPCNDNVIIGNKTTGGQQGILLSGTQQNTVVGNTVRSPKDRAIILISSTGCTITGNTCLDFGSTGVHMAYGCDDNTVSGNTVVSLTSIGEAGIQCTAGSNRNIVSGNRIRTSAAWGLYVAISSNNNKMSDNNIDYFTYSGIGIESDWNSPLPTFAIYSRASFGPPSTGNKWAFTNSVGNVFSDNRIGNKDPISLTATGIYIAQIDSYDGVSTFGLQSNTFKNNSIVSTDNVSNVYVFQETASTITNNIFTTNSFSVNAQGWVVNYGAGGAPFRSYFASCYGNTTLDDETFWSFPVNDATPSVERGVYFQTTNTIATAITNFTFGVSGQTIVVRGDVNTSIVYDPALIRTRAGGNITGLDSNKLVSFKNISGIWYEQWRNF